MQVQVKMLTTDQNAAATIQSIGIEMATPVAELILAEVWPTDILTPGIVDTFEVFIQPNFIESPSRARSIGFDEILLAMPASQAWNSSKWARYRSPDRWGRADFPSR